MKPTFLQVLKEVRPLIESGRYMYICRAIEGVLNRHKAPERLIHEYQRRIQDQLGFYAYTYSRWLLNNHPVRYYSLKVGGSIPDGAFTPGRLAWIDNMIREESK